jgi:endonuclease YncB( thermonuclease family)
MEKWFKKNGWLVVGVGIVILFFGLGVVFGFGIGKKYEGYKVSRVVDGDTLAIINLRDSREMKLRIWGINAPETKQCYFEESKMELSKILGNKEPRFEIMGYDGFGRMLAKVFIDQVDVGKQMIQRGAAVQYDAAAVHDELKPSAEYLAGLHQPEDEAKAKKLGLWDRCGLSQ